MMTYSSTAEAEIEGMMPLESLTDYPESLHR